MFNSFFQGALSLTPRIGLREEYRGRPSGRSNIDYTNLSSMVLIACKHDLDPKRLVDAFFEASENEHSHCGSLYISCRKVNQDCHIPSNRRRESNMAVSS